MTRSFAEFPSLARRTFAWDVTDGSRGAADTEFPDFETEAMAGLLAAPGTLRVPERLSGGAVAVRRLAGEDPGWAGVLELQEADNLAQERPFLDYR
ncbi:MAG TPA: hypothetical protein VFN48_03950, partial [Solirubrobacteraceae bacterium]|nr:hypothetical protein [Solirubrobacteraceae bacterium]